VSFWCHWKSLDAAMRRAVKATLIGNGSTDSGRPSSIPPECFFRLGERLQTAFDLRGEALQDNLEQLDWPKLP